MIPWKGIKILLTVPLAVSINESMKYFLENQKSESR